MCVEHFQTMKVLHLTFDVHVETLHFQSGTRDRCEQRQHP